MISAREEDIPWQVWPAPLADDEQLSAAVLSLHRTIYATDFAHDPAANHGLSVQTRAFRRLQDWRVMLILTPWMLARLLFPDRPPRLRIPADWRAEARQDQHYQVLGPRLELELLGQAQQVHLNFHPALGHYLLQPVVLNMQPYANPEAVFEAWGGVIRTRDENMEKHRKDCPWQKEVSRRELFSRWRGGGTG